MIPFDKMEAFERKKNSRILTFENLLDLFSFESKPANIPLVTNSHTTHNQFATMNNDDELIANMGALYILYYVHPSHCNSTITLCIG